MQHLNGQHVLVLGLGASGLAMARWCVRCGARVTVADTRENPPQLAQMLQALPQVRFVGGAFSPALLEDDVRAVFKSPGLRPEVVGSVWTTARDIGLWTGGELDLFAAALHDLANPPLEELAEPAHDTAAEDHDAQGASPEPVSEETQADEAQTDQAASDEAATDQPPADQPLSDDDAPLALALVPPEPVDDRRYLPKVLAITGTNGKTTVTSLTGQLVARAGKTVAVAGNIGPTLLDTLAQHLDGNTLPEVWVLELSSFQLDEVRGFEPTAAAVLNLTQDHLDWHGSMRAYAAAKARIFGERALMVLNREDMAVMAMLPAPVRMKGGKFVQRPSVQFGGDMPQRSGDFGIETVGGMRWLVRALEADETQKRRRDEAEEIFIQRLMPADALRIRGRHNATNALAALALAQAAGCQLAPMLYGLREYRGEPHRVQSVAIVHDVEYIDDSKGTNVGATVAALHSLGEDRKLIVILGGDGKGQDFSPLVAPVQACVRAVVLIGRDAPAIRQALSPTGVTMTDAQDLPQAVQLASRAAQPGEVVLLSPACASLDMFDNYAHRAQVFVQAVQALAQDAGLDLTLGEQA
jgi:UDP-N-acetylmuramoylalanine--D-glutamate ligase